MANTRHKNADWDLGEIVNGLASWNQVNSALLMDIRDELQRLNTLLYCQNFVRIPRILDEINANTKRRKHKKKA